MASIPSHSAAPSRFRKALDYPRRFPSWMRVFAAVLLALGLSAGAYYQLKTRPDARKKQRSSELWASFDRAAKSGSESELQSALDDLLRLNPDDALAKRRKESLESGSAEEDDSVMPLLTLPKHLREGRWPEAEREAGKRLAHQPKDWLSRCAKAKAALLRGDRPAALREIDQLPDPKDAASNVTPVSLLLAFDIYRELDRNPGVLRQFVRDTVVDSARSSAAESFPVAVKVQLVECYLEGFEPETDRVQPSGLSRAVLAVGRLIDLSLDDPAVDSPLLSKLGMVCARLVQAFALLRREDQITAQQYPTIARDHEARTNRAWQALLTRDPKAAPAYHGLAIAALRIDDFAVARRQVIEGLEACGENPQLLALYSLLLRADDDLLPVVARLLQAAEKDPKNASLWLLVAETAEAAGRRDVALEACAKARQVEPKNPWALRTEARIYIEAGGAHAQTGIQLLSTLGESLAGDPLAARLYVRGLNEAGLDLLIGDFLKRVGAASAAQGSPKPITQALRGITDSRYRPALAELAVQSAKALLDRYPGNVELLTVQALADFKSAEQGEPRWNETHTSGALRSFEQLQNRAPDNLEIAAAMAWVRLKGRKEPAQAHRDAAPLAAAAEQSLPLTAWQWQVLGATYLSNGKLDPAVRALEKALRLSKTAAGIHIHLALAYHAQGKKEQARAALELARPLPRSPQEHADYLDALAILQREKS